MSDQLSLYNQALVLIGDSPIDFLPGTTIQEERLNRFYDPVRLRFLECFSWNFALSRAELVRNATAPAFGWQYAYDRPVDAVSLVNVFDTPNPRDYHDSDVAHDQEGGQVLTDAEAVFVRYIRDVPIESYPELAISALAAMLAEELCIRITELRSKLSDVKDIRKERLSKARTIDTLNDDTEYLQPFAWDRSRNQGPGVSTKNIEPT